MKIRDFLKGLGEPEKGKVVEDKHLGVVPGVGALTERVIESPHVLKLTVRKEYGEPEDITFMSKAKVRAIAEEQLSGQPELVIESIEITDAARGEAKLHIRRKTAVEMMSEALSDTPE